MLTLLALIFSLTTARADFVEGTTIGVPSQSPTELNPPIFVNSYAGLGPAADSWATVDLSTVVPSGTKAARLDGILIITHGSTAETCDLHIAYRTNGSTLEPGYIHQAIETSTTGGQRSTAGVWVALDADRKFQFKWYKSTTAGTWPTYCAYGINLSLTAYLR